MQLTLSSSIWLGPKEKVDYTYPFMNPCLYRLDLFRHAMGMWEWLPPVSGGSYGIVYKKCLASQIATVHPVEISPRSEQVVVIA